MGADPVAPDPFGSEQAEPRRRAQSRRQACHFDPRSPVGEAAWAVPMRFPDFSEAGRSEIDLRHGRLPPKV
jgi:hypothetical protein